MNPAHYRLILTFISFFKKNKTNQPKEDAQQTLSSLHISDNLTTDNSGSWKWGDDWTSLFSTDDKETLRDSNHPHITHVKHNPVRWSKSQLSQRDNTPDRKQEKWNKINCMFTTALLSTHKPSLEYRIMSHSCCHGVAAHGAWHQLTPGGSDPCVDGRDRRESRARSREGNQPLPVSLPASLSHVAPRPFSGTWTLHSTPARWLLWTWHMPGEPSSSQFTLCVLLQTQIPPQPYFPNTFWDWATSLNLWAFLHAAARKKLFSGPGADLVLCQVMTHLTSARTGVYYINACKQGRNSQSLQYQQWGKMWGKVLTPLKQNTSGLGRWEQWLT